MFFHLELLEISSILDRLSGQDHDVVTFQRKTNANLGKLLFKTFLHSFYAVKR